MSSFPQVAQTDLNFNVKETISRNRLKGLLRLLKGYRLRYSGAIAALALTALLNTASLLLLRYLVDDVLVNRPDNFTQALLFTAIVFVLISAGRGIFSFVSGALTASTAEGIALRIKDYMFDHLQHLPFRYHDRQQTGELIQRATSDIDAVRRFYADQAVGIGRILLLFFVNFFALLALHWQLTLVSVLVVPVVLIMSLYFFRKVSKAYDEHQKQDAIVSNVLQENLTGVRVVKAFARQPFEIDRFEDENTKLFKLGMRFMYMHASYWPVVDLLTGFQMVFAFFLGAGLVISGDLTIGTYVSFVAMIGWIINPMRNLGRLIVQMSTGMVSYDRIAEVIAEDWEKLGIKEKPPKDTVEGHVVYKNVNFAYEHDMPVLHDISFEVKPGQTVALLGSTGSGKTSLTALLPRFYGYEGSITLDGIELTEYPRHFLRANIGIVEQEPFLFSRSIRENITYGISGEVSDEDVIAAAKAAAVHDVILEFPDQYETLVGERGVTLSGGQKQRVALARTLLKNPRILILDDATSSVDTQTESDIREALNKMMKQRTSFIIAHRIQSVMTADLILVLDKGRIVQHGTHDELMQVPGTYRQTYDMQARIEDELQEELHRVGA
ncbi:MAG: ABC transporter ATP-binding protein [Anaerolineae bacterium]|nr:ABC transporter ATP-binding protein [Anaerolineae bacterium]